MTNNYIGSIEETRAGGLVRIGWVSDYDDYNHTKDYAYPTESVTANVSGNTIECGNASDEVYTGGMIRILANETLNATVNDNYLHGGYEIGGVIRIGFVGWTFGGTPTKAVTATVINNTLDFADGETMGGIIRIVAQDTINAAVNENHLTARKWVGGRHGRGGDLGGVIHIGYFPERRDSSIPPVKNVTATVNGNYLDCGNASDEVMIGGFIRISASDIINATVNDNYLRGGYFIGGGIRIGHFNITPKTVTARVINNEMNFTDFEDLGGAIRIFARDNIDATVNENTIYGVGVDPIGEPLQGGGIRIGYNCDGPTTHVTATVNDNAIGPCRGGAIRVMANDTLDATVKNNTVSGSMGSGIRIGYFCWGESDESTPTVKATVINNTVTDNYGSGIHVAARDNLTAVIDRNNISNNTYCDSYSSDYVASGSGLYVEGGSDVTITRNTFIGNALYGIYCNGITAKIGYGNVFYNNTEGIRCENGANLTIYHNGFVNNTDFGVKNTDSSLTVNAKHNCWGNNTGPYNAVSNPTGTGDTVSDDVAYVPWVTRLGITTLDPNVTILCAYIVADPGEDPNFVPPPPGMAAYPLGFSLVATGPPNQDVLFNVTFDSPVPTDIADFGLYKILPSGAWQLIDPANYTIAGNVLTIMLHFDSNGDLDPAFQFSSGLKGPTLKGPTLKAPTLTPLGLLALLAILTVIAAISIIRENER